MPTPPVCQPGALAAGIDFALALALGHCLMRTAQPLWWSALKVNAILVRNPRPPLCARALSTEWLLALRNVPQQTFLGPVCSIVDWHLPSAPRTCAGGSGAGNAHLCPWGCVARAGLS